METDWCCVHLVNPVPAQCQTQPGNIKKKKRQRKAQTASQSCDGIKQELKSLKTGTVHRLILNLTPDAISTQEPPAT